MIVVQKRLRTFLNHQKSRLKMRFARRGMPK